MARTICIAAPIAETGKTVAAVNLSAAFAVFEKDTLLVDCCPENNCLFGAVVEPPINAPGLADALASPGRDLSAELVPTKLEHQKILPAGSGLKQAANDPKNRQMIGDRLCDAILKHSRGFDFAVIDTPTAFSSAVEAALCAADELLIPLRVDPAGAEFIEEGLLYIKSLLEEITRLKQEGRTRVTFAGLLLNCCDDQVEAEALLGPEFFKKIRNICLQVCIPEDLCLHEAFWFGKPAVCYDITAPGACAFLDLADRWIREADLTAKQGKEDLQS